MNWSDERYVRLYTRDTVTWKRWRWETRAVMGLLIRKVDRAGVLDTGRNGKVEAFALLLEVPVAVAETAVAELISSGTMVESDTGYLLPTFIEAQEAPQSDAARQRESRDRRRAAKLRDSEAGRHELSQHVTPSHTASQPVTPAVPSVPSVPSRAGAAAHAAEVLVDDQAASSGSDFWRLAQEKRAAAGLVREREPHPRQLSAWFSEALLELNGDAEKLLRGYDAFLVDPWWRNEAQQRCGWGGWVRQWRDFVTKATAPPVMTAKKRATVEEGADWSNVKSEEVTL